MSSHVALLGDSMFDNRAYTAGAPDVTEHLRARLPKQWRATLGAVDGSTTADIPRQLARVPADATHLAVAVGGNDALGNLDLLATRVASTAEALALFGTRALAFEASYRAAVESTVRLGRDTT